MECHRIAILQNNFVFVLHEGPFTAVVDPGEAEPVKRFLREKGWSLNLILITHHHPDHVDGILELVKEYACSVWCSEPDLKRVPGADRGLEKGEQISLGSAQAQVLEFHGHTSGHIGFYLPESGWLFSGDTVFGLGCGRVFDGRIEDLFSSLQQIRSLPPETKIFCTHEYTNLNMSFARRWEPGNEALQRRLTNAKDSLAKGEILIPLRLSEEIATNPFFRWDSPEIRTGLEMSSASDFEVFQRLRQLRNEA